MQDYRARIAAPSGVEQELFDGGLLDSVIAERVPGHVFSYGHTRRTPVHPHGAAMKQLREARGERAEALV